MDNDRDFSEDELHADVSPTVGDMIRWLENTKDDDKMSVVLVFNRMDRREHEAEIWRQETSKMTSDEVQQYKSLLKQCGIKPKG